MKNIRVTNFGQIKEADINFGDLTLFVGPQATGKSILLQLIKLLLDRRKIVFSLYEHGYELLSNSNSFLELYFGEGMNSIWGKNTEIFLDEKNIILEKLIDVFKIINELQENSILYNESLFLIPAQRVITLANGWPSPFSSFEAGDPYAVRNFSEQLRRIMQNSSKVGIQTGLFPPSKSLTKYLDDEIDKSIFYGASVVLKTTGMRKQLYIDIEGNSLPFMAWSAGQREFIPLLLCFYWITSIKVKQAIRKKIKTNKITDSTLEWVVIEEPEMGLHPQAIVSVILMCLELLNQGYKLIISTHSPVLLEAAWAIRFLQRENPDIKYLYQLFELEPSSSMTALFKNTLKNKTFFTYYFDQQKDGVYVKDISSLDPGNLDDAIADWGGLTSFSSRASEVVSQAVQEKT